MARDTPHLSLLTRPHKCLNANQPIPAAGGNRQTREVLGLGEQQGRKASMGTGSEKEWNCQRPLHVSAEAERGPLGGDSMSPHPRKALCAPGLRISRSALQGQGGSDSNPRAPGQQKSWISFIEHSERWGVSGTEDLLGEVLLSRIK